MKKLFIYSLLLVLSLLYWSCSKDSNPVNTTPSDKPTAEIISPANNSDVSDTTTILVNASDDKGVTRVEIFIDDVLVTKLLTAPYKYIWETQSLSDSTLHTIYARAVDSDGNMVLSKMNTVTVRVLSPTNLTVTQINDGTVLLTWSDNSRIETGYEIENSVNGSNFVKLKTLGASVIKDTVSSLKIDSSYTFRIRAISKNKVSKYAISTTKQIVLNSPTIVGAYFFNDSVSVFWKNNDSFSSSIEISMSTDSMNFAVTKTLSSNLVYAKWSFARVEGLKYYFKARAYGEFNFSKYSATSILNDVRLNMVLVEGGTYTMGDANFATPLHLVTLSSYYISKTEITQGQYRAIMGINPSKLSSNGDNAPVETVTWYDCISYCNKLSLSEGKIPCYNINGETNPSNWTVGTIVCDFSAKGYRLATEAEWEYAAKGGLSSARYTYSGGNTLNNVAWNSENSGRTSHIVASKTANELGINDMSGNVWEWCWDWDGNYSSSQQTNPTGALSGTYRIMRGGAYYYLVDFCLPGYRLNNDPSIKNSYGGFRVVQGQ